MNDSSYAPWAIVFLSSRTDSLVNYLIYSHMFCDPSNSNDKRKIKRFSQRIWTFVKLRAYFTWWTYTCAILYKQYTVFINKILLAISIRVITYCSVLKLTLGILNPNFWSGTFIDSVRVTSRVKLSTFFNIIIWTILKHRQTFNK